MTVLDLSKRLNGLANELATCANGDIPPILASDALALIRQRVQETGEDPNGSSFAPYSRKTTLVGPSSFFRKDVGESLFASKTKRSKLEWRTVGIGTDKMRPLALLPGGYAKIRELQGRQTKFVDFTLTGRMLGDVKVGEKGDVQIISDNNDHVKGYAILGATQELEKKKLAWNTEKKGTILGLSKKEISMISKTYDSLLNKLLKKHGLI